MDTHDSKAFRWLAGLCMTWGLACSADGAPHDPPAAARSPLVVAPPQVQTSYRADDVATCAAGTCAGTETQALETFDGTLFAGMSNWMESDPAVYPAASAQVLRRQSLLGPWAPAPTLSYTCPSAPAAGPMAGVWEQVNDLQALTVMDGAGAPHAALLAATMPNMGLTAACPELVGTVYVGQGSGAAFAWSPLAATPHLGTLLQGYYNAPGHSAEVRYLAVSTVMDGCSVANPCVFAAVGAERDEALPPPTPPTDCTPPATAITPTVWRATSAVVGGVVQLTWDATPLLKLDGCQAQVASRIVSMVPDPYGGVLVGTAIPKDQPACQDPTSLLCPRASLYRIDPDGTITRRWVGSAPVAPGATPPQPVEVRGIASVSTPGGVHTWFFTQPNGRMRRFDPGATTPVLEALGGASQPPAGCAGFYGYQILHMPAVAGNVSALLVAAEGCQSAGGHAVGFYRRLDATNPTLAADENWLPFELPSIVDRADVNPPPSAPPPGAIQSHKVREDALRWLHVPPTPSCDLWVGTGDMNSRWGNSRTAGVYRVVNPFNQANCPAPPP